MLNKCYTLGIFSLDGMMLNKFVNHSGLRCYTENMRMIITSPWALMRVNRIMFCGL